MTESLFQEVLNLHCNREELKQSRPVGGGCIHHATRLITNRGTYFLKWNTGSEQNLFATEAVGLSLLRKNLPSQLHVPNVLGVGIAEEKAYLLLEWIESGQATASFWEKFGTGLAGLHQITKTNFGLEHDNYIGRLPQSNAAHSKWSDFFRTERLEPQIALASRNNLISSSLRSSFERLYLKLDALIPTEVPALIHGDLWSGNFMVNESSLPVLVDPAIHFGHRETELAFTLLFGGFEQRFYDTYQSHFPMEPGFEERVDVHNLYPLLVHLNLFGSSYLSGITSTLKRFA